MLRIISNFLAIRGRTPTINELTIKTGRFEKSIYKSLAVLADEDFIEWSQDDPESILLLRAWENPPPEYNDYKLFIE
ncbi:hypothetical protein [Paenibacillus silviterrae]|uniref:hypothetical protein n=1 Tax=Paenibacillus silviterrae TaxID=3242194 RepID=UPI002543B654|nr:hypothetical protein [Paenibacillus chinjuensis]